MASSICVRMKVAGIAAFLADIYKDFPTEKECNKAPGILPKYKELYEVNPDLILSKSFQKMEIRIRIVNCKMKIHT